MHYTVWCFYTKLMQEKSDSNFQEQVGLRILVSFSHYIARLVKGFNTLLTKKRENMTYNMAKWKSF